MGFVLVAVDHAQGIEIRSLGSRGPEIEREVWQAKWNGHIFEFSTYVTGETIQNRRKVWISPSVPVIDYLMHGTGTPEERKAKIDHVQNGIHLLFPTYFKLPFFFERLAAVKVDFIEGRPKFHYLDAPTLWDAVRPAPNT